MKPISHFDLALLQNLFETSLNAAPVAGHQYIIRLIYTLWHHDVSTGAARRPVPGPRSEPKALGDNMMTILQRTVAMKFRSLPEGPKYWLAATSALCQTIAANAALPIFCQTAKSFAQGRSPHCIPHSSSWYTDSLAFKLWIAQLSIQ